MADTSILQAADRFIEENWEGVVAGIARLVSVPSVVDFERATAESPSGQAAHDGLAEAVALAHELGFDAHDDEGEVGVADLNDEDDTVLALMCHSDVVAAGPGWTQDPWTMNRRDGYLSGRGVIDDKGPLVVGLYAMKFFLEQGKTLPHTLRMIIGTNEETGAMRDVAYYLNRYGAPAFMFTPDNAFPVGYGEKGMWRIDMVSAPMENGRIVDFTTGEQATNAVPGEADMVLKVDASHLPACERIRIEAREDGCASLHETGVSAHASTPEKGESAIGKLVDYVLANNLATDSEIPYLQAMARTIATTDGSALGIECSDEHFGPLTCVLGTVHKTEDDHLKCSIDIRFPTTVEPRRITQAFEQMMGECDGHLENPFLAEPFLMDPDGAAVQTMARCYREATGFEGKPFTSGGATYAREFPRAVSFGVEDEHDDYPAWVGGMHGADEGVAEITLKRALKVYIYTIDQLMKLDLTAEEF